MKHGLSKHRLKFAFGSLIISETMKCRHSDCGVVYNYFTGEWVNVNKGKKKKKSSSAAKRSTVNV